MIKYLIVLSCFLTSLSIKASDYAYFGFEPDIVTNYVATKKKMGYMRLTVELMVEGDNLEIVEHHAPLLRDAISISLADKLKLKLNPLKAALKLNYSVKSK